MRPAGLPLVVGPLVGPLLGGLLAGCAPAEAAEPHLRFVDVAPEAGIDVVQVSGDPRRWYIPESNGAGAAWLDHDGDGDVDLFVANGQGLRYVDDGSRLEVLRVASSRLYRNDGGMRFADVTDETGARRSEWQNAVAVGDVENDGDPDLYLACFDPDVLLRNDGGRFADATADAGLGSPAWGAGAAFGDPDRDGDLDLYVANYVAFDLDAPPHGGRRNEIEGVEVGWGPIGENGEVNPGAPDAFYANDGDGAFADATAAAGLELAEPLCSYAAVFADVDADGWPDLLVANDLQPCNLFHNRGDGTFVEEGVARGFALDGDGRPTSAMGLLVADVDRDGDLDCLRTNFDLEPNSLHLNDGEGRFAERARAHGLAEPSLDRLGWGGAFLDADLDGDLDCLVANGHVMPQAPRIGMSGWVQRTQLYEAVADPERGVVWRDATDRAGPGLAPLRSARGVAVADADDDGDLDALVTDLDAPPRLLENRSERRGRWLAVRLEGTRSNAAGVGARVEVRAEDGGTWTAEAGASGGLYSAHDPRLHFGLGRVDRVAEVVVRWPSGVRQVVADPPLDRVLVVREPEAAR